MTPENNELDRALNQIQNEPIDPSLVEAAAGRVWNRLQPAGLHNCTDFQALFPDYRAGNLPEARALLVKDHLHECVACRKAYEGPRKVLAMPMRRMAPWVRWAVAAAVVVAAGLGAWGVYRQLGSAGTMVVQAANGTVYQALGGELRTVAAGTELAGGGEIRTARDSGAMVRLGDGSVVEMRERSSFSVNRSGRDLTVRLGRGSIIIQAAKRRTGHLYVATRDCRVAVTGTVFSVSSGLKGSRVAVIEGQVEVSQGRQEQVLKPGEQYSSDPSLTPVPVRDEIAWSRNLDRHIALMKEFSSLEKNFNQLPLPDLRYESRLFGMLPADTRLYLAIPNLANSFAEAGRIVTQRAQESPVLQEWLQSQKHFPEMLDKLRAAGEYFGNEMVVAVAGSGRAPVFLAELKKPGLQEYLQTELAKVGGRDALRVVTDPASVPAGKGNLLMYLRSDLVIFSPDGASLAAVAPAGGGFAGTDLGKRVAESYRSGAGLILAADLQKMAAARPAGRHADSSGFEKVKYVLVEHKESAGRSDARALLAFDGARQGIASWLGKPGPITALEYVSPDATLVSAFALRSPAELLDQMPHDFARIEAETGINIRQDLAAPLGSEFAFATDGPALPVPAWKLAVEVYDANRLQYAIRKLADSYNSHASAKGKPVVTLTQETAAGRTWYRLLSPAMGKLGEIHYTFIDGYLLAAPSRALVERAIQYRSSGYTLVRSEKFTSMLPRDRYTDFSGVVYQNMGTWLNPFIESLTPGSKERQALEGISSNFTKPLLVVFYGENDYIVVAGHDLPFGFSPAGLVRMTAPMAMMRGLGRHK